MFLGVLPYLQGFINFKELFLINKKFVIKAFKCFSLVTKTQFRLMAQKSRFIKYEQGPFEFVTQEFVYGSGSCHNRYDLIIKFRH